MMTPAVDAIRLKALDFSAPNRAVVDAARLLAGAAVADLDRAECVEIDFTGLRGVSSSYFNVLFGDVVRALGPTALRTRLVCHYETKGQAELAGRSLAAVIDALGGPASQSA